MTDKEDQPVAPSTDKPGDSISPLEGEPGIPSVTQASRSALSWKGIFAAALMLFSLVAVTVAALNRALSGQKKDGDDATRMGERPMAAANEPRRLDLTLSTPKPVLSPVKSIPAIVPIAEDSDPAPIGVRRTGQTPSGASSQQQIAPEDAPVMLVTSRPGSNTPIGPAPSNAHALAGNSSIRQDDSLQATKRNLEGYQRQLQGLLDTLSRQATASDSPLTPPAPAPSPTPTRETGRFGNQPQGSATPPVVAARLHNRSLTLPKGTSFTCALKTRIVSAASGMVGCQVQRNVYGDDGRVLLIERGSHIDGEYRITSVRPGTVRIPVLWTHVRTPNGVTVDIDSPATGALGEAGVEGFVDNRWGERIGAAMLLSLIDDAVKLSIQDQANDRQGDTVILSSTTSNSSKLAEKVLDSTINIPPLVYQNQGGIVCIYVARDVDFSNVYELKAVPR